MTPAKINPITLGTFNLRNNNGAANTTSNITTNTNMGLVNGSAISPMLFDINSFMLYFFIDV